MLHFNQLHPPTLPPLPKKYMIGLRYRPANNNLCYFINLSDSIHPHPPQMSDFFLKEGKGGLHRLRVQAQRMNLSRSRISASEKEQPSSDSCTFPLKKKKKSRAHCSRSWVYIRSGQKHIMVCGDGFWGVLIRRGEHLSLFVRVVDHISPYEQTLLRCK